MVAVAIGGAAIIGAGVSVSASNKASNTARDTAASNAALQSQINNENQAKLQPFEDRGNTAGTAINSLLGLGGDPNSANAAFDAYKGSTEYASRLKQGQDSVTAALGSKGLLDSGAALKSLTNYGQTAASNEFGSYIGNLQGQQSAGLSAAGTQVAANTNYANAVTGSNTAAANTQANAALSNASTINGALGNLVGAYGYSQGAGLGSSYGNAKSTLSPFARGEANAIPSYGYGNI